eukprot:366250-Chlamydomonas_euryale.AAC.5
MSWHVGSARRQGHAGSAMRKEHADCVVRRGQRSVTTIRGRGHAAAATANCFLHQLQQLTAGRMPKPLHRRHQLADVRTAEAARASERFHLLGTFCRRKGEREEGQVSSSLIVAISANLWKLSGTTSKPFICFGFAAQRMLIFQVRGSRGFRPVLRRRGHFGQPLLRPPPPNTHTLFVYTASAPRAQQATLRQAAASCKRRPTPSPTAPGRSCHASRPGWHTQTQPPTAAAAAAAARPCPTRCSPAPGRTPLPVCSPRRPQSQPPMRDQGGTACAPARTLSWTRPVATPLAASAPLPTAPPAATAAAARVQAGRTRTTTWHSRVRSRAARHPPAARTGRRQRAPPHAPR